VEVHTIDDVECTIELMRKELSTEKPTMQKLNLEFVTLEKVPIHSQLGIPQIYYDQFNIVARHHLELKEKAEIVLDYKKD